MASRKISDLKVDFAKKIYKLEDRCLEQGIDILFYCTYRPPEEQAEHYRAGRSSQEIIQKMEQFEEMGLVEISDIIQKVGPQYGDKVTNAAPFESWHQYREAADGVPVKGGKALWNATEMYYKYGNIATELGLVWAGNWDNFTEFPHVQLRNESNPFNVFSIEQIKEAIRNT